MGFTNKISLLRIVLVPVIIVLLFFFNPDRIYLRKFIVVIFSIAVITDFIDGLYARLRKEKTEFGKLIDPLADKFLLLNAFFGFIIYANPCLLSSNCPFG